VTTPDATTVTVRRDRPFHAPDGEQLLLDAYESPASTGPKPAVVFVRGGGFTAGDKGEFARQAIDVAEAGYLAVEPQYRLAPEYTFPAPLVDVKAAIQWCRADERVDPQRVAAVGHSAGANLAVLAAATADDPGLEPEQYPGASSALSAAVGYSGIYDFRMRDGDDTAYLGDSEAALDLASPVEQADASMPPTLLLHGDADTVASPQQTAVMAERLDPLTTVVSERVDGGHGFPFDGAHYDATYDRTADFLGQHLGTPGEDGGPPSGPDPTQPPSGGAFDGPDRSPR
jgi:acetyl esterase/lipase